MKRGYKEMLRDRCPQTVSFALKWQKAKEKWVDHAYANFIKFYVDNNEKNHAARIVLGIAKYFRNFDFHKSIDWDNLDPEETLYWKRVEDWVDWFRRMWLSIKNTYDISVKVGKSDFDIRVEIIQTYLNSLLPTEEDKEELKQAKYKYVDKLVEFLIKSFKDV